MKITASTQKTILGFLPKVKVNDNGFKYSSTVSVCYVEKKDALEHAKKQVSEAIKTGWI